MISISNVSAAQATSYYEKDDYYTESGHMPASFGGRLAEKIGVAGEFDLAKFQDALRGKFERASLKQANTGKRAALDITFSAPKSFSIMALVAGDRRLIEIHQRAVKAGMDKFEELATYRVKEGGKDGKVVPVRSPDGLAYASFLHDTSRKGDCQVHTHNVVYNAVMGEDGTLRALENRQFFLAAKAADAEYKSVCARDAIELGYPIELTKDGFELAGLSDLILEFSQRSRDIDAALQARGTDRESASNAERQKAALNTRDTKKKYDRHELLQWWQSRAAGRLIPIPGGGDVPSIAQPSAEVQAELALTAVELAIEHLSERNSVLGSRHTLLAHAIQAAGYIVPSEKIHQAIDSQLESGELIERNGKLITRAMLETETAIIQMYRDGKGAVAPVAHAPFAEEQIALVEKQFSEKTGRDGKLTQGQRDMVINITTGADRVNVVEGDAGTGKSTAMQAVQQIAQAQGFSVLGLGPSAQAVDALKAAGIETTTVQSALGMGGKKFWDSVDARTLIVLDEAGLVDVRSMQKLIQRATQLGARIAPTGDQKQFSSVEAGRALYQLAKEAKVDGSLSRLDEMRRGRTEEMRALHLAARDDPAKALQALLENGHVTAFQTDSKRFKSIARDYAVIPREERSQTLVLTGKNDDRKAINAAIRERLGITGTGRNFSTFEADDFTAAQTKQLGSYALGATVRFERDAGKFKRGEQVQVIERHANHVILERKNGKKAPFYPNKEAGKGVTIGAIEQAEFAVGDRARVTANDKEKGVSNGDRGEVMEITESSMTLRLDSGRMIKLDTKAGVLNLRHGYAQTGHSAQGATAGRVFLHMPSKDATIDRSAFYTNLTRAANTVHIYTDAKGDRKMSALMQSVEKSKARELVTELINKPNIAAIGKEPPPAARGRLRALSELDMEQNVSLNKSANISIVSFVKLSIIDEHKQGVTHDDRNRANKPNIAAIGKEPPPAARGRLRALSELGVARLGGGNQVLLPGDVHHQLDQHETRNDRGVRRPVAGVVSQPPAQAIDVLAQARAKLKAFKQQQRKPQQDVEPIKPPTPTRDYDMDI